MNSYQTKAITATVFCILLTLMGGSFIPFYGAMAGPLAVGLFLNRRMSNFFFTSFIGVFLAWAGYASFMLFTAQGDFADQIAALFGLSSGYILILITGLVGGVTGGLITTTIASLRYWILSF